MLLGEIFQNFLQLFFFCMYEKHAETSGTPKNR